MQPVSFVVPVYNEQENIARLHEEIVAVARTLGTEFEIIMVDDGSTDNTFKVLKSMCEI